MEDLLALEPEGAYWTSKKALVLGMTAVDEKDRWTAGWKEQLREEEEEKKEEGGVMDLRRDNIVNLLRGTALVITDHLRSNASGREREREKSQGPDLAEPVMTTR